MIRITKKEFINLYKTKTAFELAREFKCSINTIYKLAARLGIKKGSWKIQNFQEFMNDINHLNRKELCEKYNISHQLLYYYLNKFKIKKNYDMRKKIEIIEEEQ